jgi:crotonobetainyl-CoA:carnitine CoA-transferase CaiB-like acyl-CoA transferase
MSLPEVFADPQVRHQEMQVTIDHPVHGKLDVLGFPIKFTDDPCRVHRPPPVLGADADAILRELGYSAHDIGELHARRIA